MAIRDYAFRMEDLKRPSFCNAMDVARNTRNEMEHTIPGFVTSQIKKFYDIEIKTDRDQNGRVYINVGKMPEWFFEECTCAGLLVGEYVRLLHEFFFEESASLQWDVFAKQISDILDRMDTCDYRFSYIKKLHRELRFSEAVFD